MDPEPSCSGPIMDVNEVLMIKLEEPDFESEGSDYEPGMFDDDDTDGEIGDDDDCGDKNFGNCTADVGHSTHINREWYDVSGTRLKRITFTGVEKYNYKSTYPTNKDDLRPHHVYLTFFDDEIVNLIVTETNRNAAQYLDDNNVSPGARMKCWVDTTPEEIRKFFGVAMYMGLVTYPTVEDYWSRNVLFKNNILPKIMSRNRFQLLLRCINFSDDKYAEEGDRTHKIREISEMLQKKFCAEYVPGEIVAIDETMVPFRGQYVPGKSHKYGIKIFKLHSSIGYTLRMVTYTGRLDVVGEKLAEKVVLDLAEDYVGEGRTVITDSCYTSVPLAKQLLDKRTHLLGTLNRSHLPPIIQSKIKEGEIIGKESSDGIVVGKWMDKGEVFFLSTKHVLDMVRTGKKDRTGTEKLVPALIVDYNNGRQGIDISDQMASYFSPLRKTIRWYHKVVFELLLNSSVVNASILFRMLTGKKMQMKNFRIGIIQHLLGVSTDQEESRSQQISPKSNKPSRKNLQGHCLMVTEEKDERNRKVRKRCQECYLKMVKIHGRSEGLKRVKKVVTLCQACNKWLCSICYSQTH